MNNDSHELKNIVELKTEDDTFQVEYEVLSPDIKNDKINAEISNIDEMLQQNQEKLNKLDKSIDKLTNHADGLDYAIAVTSGIITGIIDIIIVGGWDFRKAKDISNEEINKKVVDFAKRFPDYTTFCNYKLDGKGNPRRKPLRPESSISATTFLEWKFKLPGDGAYKMGHFKIDGNTHRLDDLCHHPTLVGLVCCVLVQFTEHTRYVNKLGENINIPVTVNEYGNFVGRNPLSKLFAGVINWFITCSKTIANRKGHLMSDIATNASLPGGFLSTITELAEIPCFRDKEFLNKLRKAYVKGIGENQVDLGKFNILFEGASNKFDIKTEMAIKHELKRQSMPVVINEVLVRASYFIRHLIKELKEKKEVLNINWSNVIPLNNRTIVRMMTIASGTFMAIDMADAAFCSIGPRFAEGMLLRVNFVGIGRFTVAVTTDVGMGISRAIKRNQRIKLYEDQIALTDAKVFYKQAGLWVVAGHTGEAIKAAYEQAQKSVIVFKEAINDIENDIEQINDYILDIEEKNEGLTNDITDIIEWE